MADYYRLLSRVVAGIEKNNGENRRAIYDRARSAVVRQLRAIVPVLSESDITRERLALEEAIRRVEAECERNLAVSRRLSPAEIRPCHRAPMAAEFGSFTLAKRSPSGMEFEQSAPCTLARCLSDRICKLAFQSMLAFGRGLVPVGMVGRQDRSDTCAQRAYAAGRSPGYAI